MSPVVFSYSKRVVQLCVAFVAVALNPAPLRALDIGTFGDTTVSLGSNVRAGYAVVTDGDVGHGPMLRYARLKLGARHERAGALKLQVEAASGTVRLLDAVAEIRICDHLRWQAGRYKAPTSLDVQMGSASYAFSRRACAWQRGSGFTLASRGRCTGRTRRTRISARCSTRRSRSTVAPCTRSRRARCGRGGVTLPWRNAPVTIGVEGDITSRDSSLSGGVFAWGQVGI